MIGDLVRKAFSSTALRFGGVGVINTAIDTGLFVLLHDRLGILLANLASTSAGMTFSFIVNGLFTFRAEKLTVRHAATFLATTGLTMWAVQPVAIHLLLGVIDQVLVAKLVSIAICFVLNFAAYRLVVWPVDSSAVGEPYDPELT
ncbi:GtrA family protein [Nocardioides marmoriginsengisoli]|uniref:GtrA family protein n=1 Tax=Nocardioides marmoriginsengisoli TaxID=661483 RepID=A0A3N0CPD7_9ACTN|nr:GtrA family protein [Nocardioides marmoriginsengisoli]